MKDRVVKIGRKRAKARKKEREDSFSSKTHRHEAQAVYKTVQTPIPTLTTILAPIIPAVPSPANTLPALLSAAPAVATVIGVWPGNCELALATPPKTALPKAHMERIFVTIVERFAPPDGSKKAVWFVCSKQSTHCGYADWNVSAQAHWITSKKERGL